MKLLVSFLLTFLISFSALGYDLSLKEVEGRKLVKGGYLDTLYDIIRGFGTGRSNYSNLGGDA